MADVKFSQFASGGQLTNGDIIVGLRDGVNTQFTSPDSPGGPFLLKSANLSDVDNTLESFQNLGFGSGQTLILDDADFVGGEYHLANPCPNYISLLCDTPGNILFLPPGSGADSFNLSEGPYIQVVPGFQSVEIDDSAGDNLIVLTSPSLANFTLNDKSTPEGSWTTNFRVSLINGMSGLVTLLGSNIFAAYEAVNYVPTSEYISGHLEGIDDYIGDHPQVVKSWDGSTDPVDVTAGSGIDITDGIISLDGSGASAGYGYIVPSPSAFDIGWTSQNQYLIPITLNTTLVNDTNNFIYYTDNPFGNGHGGIEYIGAEPCVVEITFVCNFQFNNANPNPNNYALSANLNLQGDGGGGFLPINEFAFSGGYKSYSDINFTVNPTTGSGNVIIIFQIPMENGDRVFPNVRNDGPSDDISLNNIIMTKLNINAIKIGDVGGSTAGVESLNGITGNIDIASPNGSVGISVAGFDLNLSVGQFQEVTGTSQAMVANKSYFCSNVANTTLSLPTSNCPKGSFLEIAGGPAQIIVSQGSGQSIIQGNDQSTVGISGNITSNNLNPYSCLKLVCIDDDTTFQVIYSQGNFTLN